MSAVIRIDKLRAGEQELHEAFARGDLDQHLREYVAAFQRADYPIPDWLTAIQTPGPDRERACRNLAKQWAALETKQTAIEYARGVLSTRTLFADAQVVPLRPATRAPSLLASLVDRVTQAHAEWRGELDAARERTAAEREELRAQWRALKD